jgi:hypothetical protein
VAKPVHPQPGNPKPGDYVRRHSVKGKIIRGPERQVATGVVGYRVQPHTDQPLGTESIEFWPRAEIEPYDPPTS